MDVSRPALGIPVLCLDNFLTDEAARGVLEECINLRSCYTPATIFEGLDGTKVDPSYRNNEVVYLDSLFRADRSRSRVLTELRARIWDKECKLLWHEGYLLFDTINYSTWQEATISRNGNGAFYKKHRDTTKVNLSRRLTTLVYYVNQEPPGFTGGALALWHGTDCLRLAPKHNRAILFPSFAIHEVEKTVLPADSWENGRFSINYWMGFG
jgi:hypothetical protein